VAEYIETVRRATGVEIESDARRLLPRDVRADGFTNTAYSLGVDLGHVEAYAKLARLIAGRMDLLAFAAEHAVDEPLRQKLSGTAAPQHDDEELRHCFLGMAGCGEARLTTRNWLACFAWHWPCAMKGVTPRRCCALRWQRYSRRRVLSIAWREIKLREVAGPCQAMCWPPG
jgi:hypothetical protein